MCAHAEFLPTRDSVTWPAQPTQSPKLHVGGAQVLPRSDTANIHTRYARTPMETIPVASSNLNAKRDPIFGGVSKLADRLKSVVCSQDPCVSMTNDTCSPTTPILARGYHLSL